jgi:pimeloyl-ACP methyl ester carboxylesterase
MDNVCASSGGERKAMSSSSSFPPLSDETIQLPDGRTLAYRTCGCSAATTVKSVVFAFHGALGTGNFDHWSALFERHGWFVVAPTLPGWGLSSGNPGYALQYFAEHDMQHLADHIFNTVLQKTAPADDNLKRDDDSFLCLGISYGCVHAIACAVHLSTRVSALCLLGPHGPFDDPSFDPLKGMALSSQMGLGSMGFYLPWLTRLTGRMVQRSVSTPPQARKFVTTNLLEAMTSAEKEQFGAVPAELRETIASGRGLHDSLCNGTIQGYIDIPCVLRSWSFRDLQRVQCPTHIFVAEGDVQTPEYGAKYIHQHVGSSKLTVFEEGGHMTLVFWFDKCVDAFVAERS